MASDDALSPAIGLPASCRPAGASPRRSGPAGRPAASARPEGDARQEATRPIGEARPSGPAAADPDAVCVRLAQTGDRKAFETLLRRHYDRMHRIAWRMTGSREDAEDVVQEVCCGLAGRLGGFRGDALFSTWLYGVVANASRDHRRRGAALARLKEGLGVLVGLARPADGRDLYRRSWLASSIGQLDPGLRAAVVLCVGEGMTHAEAGLALGIAEATVSWRLHEARRRLGRPGSEGDVP